MQDLSVYQKILSVVTGKFLLNSVEKKRNVNKTFTSEIERTDSDKRNQLIQTKWNDLAQSAIIIGLKPFLFEHSITEFSIIISVTAYKSPPWFVRFLYFLCPRSGFSLPLWGRRGMK